MRTKVISKLTIAQLAYLPLISISCGKHEQKAKENLVVVARDPKFDKLIDKNKGEKWDKTVPIVEKIEVVNNGESESKYIEKSKKVEIKNPNNPNSAINVEVKNDIKIDNKINTKESKLKTFFVIVGGLATTAAIGYGLWWLFKDNYFFSINSEKNNEESKIIYKDSQRQVKVTIKYKCTGNCETYKNELKTVGTFTITNQKFSLTLKENNSDSERTITIEGAEKIIFEVINKISKETTIYTKKSITNWQRFLNWIKNKI